MVASVVRAAPVSESSAAAASAAPSAGSVPLPISSSSTSVASSASVRMLPQRGEVRREGREVGGDRLVVADVREEPGEHRQLAAGAHRRDDAALRQRAEEPDRLEQDGLAAGVGTADDERALVRVERQVERHDRLARRQEQRVPPVHDDERAPAPRAFRDGTPPTPAA